MSSLWLPKFSQRPHCGLIRNSTESKVGRPFNCKSPLVDVLWSSVPCSVIKLSSFQFPIRLSKRFFLCIHVTVDEFLLLWLPSPNRMCIGENKKAFSFFFPEQKKQLDSVFLLHQVHFACRWRVMAIKWIKWLLWSPTIVWATSDGKLFSAVFDMNEYGSLQDSFKIIRFSWRNLWLKSRLSNDF